MNERIYEAPEKLFLDDETKPECGPTKDTGDTTHFRKIIIANSSTTSPATFNLNWCNSMDLISYASMTHFIFHTASKGPLGPYILDDCAGLMTALSLSVKAYQSSY